MTHKLYFDPRATLDVYAELELFGDFDLFKNAVEQVHSEPVGETRSFIYSTEEMFRAGNIGKLFLVADQNFSGVYDCSILAQQFFYCLVVPSMAKAKDENFNSARYQADAISVFTENLFRQILEIRGLTSIG